jgi:hypothetical protein
MQGTNARGSAQGAMHAARDFFLIEKSVHWWSAAAQTLNAPDRVGK